jgi:RNA polymerase sigma factor (sigma-70 family)
MGRWRSSAKGASLDEIERAYRARFAEYRRVATAIMGDPERARDAVQEAFATAVRKRASFRREGPIDAWLWRAVVNAALNQRRRTPSTLPLAFEDLPASDDGGLEEVGDDVRAAIGDLPERQRLALFLRYYADLDYVTIASVLGVTQGTVGATLHAAHRAVRGQFEEVRS